MRNCIDETTRRRPARRRLSVSPAVAVIVLCAIFVVACDDASGDTVSPTPHTEPTAVPAAQLSPGLPVVIAMRHVCRLAGDSPSAQAAQITGIDGSQSAVAGGTQYWFFGDTVRRGETRQDVIPAAVATTTDLDAADCLDLQFKTVAGLAAPLFPRLEETTAWPDGVLPVDDGSILFYMVKAVRESPFAWHVGGVGLGRVLPGTTEGERLVETIWDGDSGFGSRVSGVRSPVRVGEDIVAYLRTDDGRNFVIRAPLARIGERDAYEYRTADGWSADPADAEPMWSTQPTGFPPDNGVQVSFDERTDSWLALYNAGLAAVDVRTAPEPWGPWSAPVRWLECEPFAQERYPYCYTGELHRQLAKDGGLTQYITVSTSQPYDVSLIELHMATAITAWRSENGRLRYVVDSPGNGYVDAGFAFYASEKMAPGLVPVFTVAGGLSHSLDPQGDAPPAFYAYASPPGGAVPVQPVALVDGALVTGGEGEALFYVPCVFPENSACSE